MNENKWIQAALDAGAYKAAVLPAAQIALSETFRDLCRKNQCGVYGRCWTCPPDCGEIGELMNRVRTYSYALLYQSVGALEDSFDIEGMQEVKKQHVQTCQKLHTALLASDVKDFWHLGAGGCGICETCTKPSGAPCRHPDRALISMEACGVDVYNTVKDTQLKYINGQNTVTYFGMVLFHDEA